jgi:protein phosphatase
VAIEVRWGSATHVGCVRATNQDSILAGPVVFAVADGMGGHAAGEVASAIAVARLADLDARPTGEQILSAVRLANAEVIAQAPPGSGREGMGTTLSGLAVADHGGDESLLVFNVGDSRTYRLDSSGLTQITNDHSLVAEMVRDGELAPDEAPRHRSRNVVTRAIGIAAEVRVDHWWIAPEPGQTFLMCSDGLTNEVSVSVIEGVLRAAASPQAAVDSLVGIALDAGARDNVSAIAVRVESITVEPSRIEEDTARRVTDGIDERVPPHPPSQPVTSMPLVTSSVARATPSLEVIPVAPAILIDAVPGTRPDRPAACPAKPTPLVTGVPSTDEAADEPLGG